MSARNGRFISHRRRIGDARSVAHDCIQHAEPGAAGCARCTTCTGAISTAPARMTIFLFDVIEDPDGTQPAAAAASRRLQLRTAQAAGAADPALPADALERFARHRSPAAGARAADPARRRDPVRSAAAGRARRQQRRHQAQARAAHARGADPRVACRAAAVSPFADLRRARHPHRLQRRDGAPAGAVAHAGQLRSETAHELCHRLPSERTVLYSQIGLRLVDEFTGGPLLHPRRLRSSASRTAPATGSRSSSSPFPRRPATCCIPGSAAAPTSSSHRWCAIACSSTSDFYRPEYLRTADALEFDIHPYDDSQPPAVLSNLPHTVLMLPSVTYPYAAFVRTVRGRTLDVNRRPDRQCRGHRRRPPSACSATSAASSRCRCAGCRSAAPSSSTPSTTAPDGPTNSPWPCRRTCSRARPFTLT